MPICIIDTVFSIGVRYTSTRNTVLKYCKYFDLEVYRDSRYKLPEIEKQESVSQFMQKIRLIGTENFLGKFLRISKELLLGMGY